ncbi:hypothetical protein OBBRIDRAFT_874221 [Obba rivulosa]|uniref:Uncharacterized protein n=1 Tax=Obba rivulosa TaxID=1052685 RepID=A0A8E2DMM6_9APHY|nr:hypothetical protein OBBRIDRAFT_874221 [Obba rivulosa]
MRSLDSRSGDSNKASVTNACKIDWIPRSLMNDMTDPPPPYTYVESSSRKDVKVEEGSSMFIVEKKWSQPQSTGYGIAPPQVKPRTTTQLVLEWVTLREQEYRAWSNCTLLEGQLRNVEKSKLKGAHSQRPAYDALVQVAKNKQKENQESNEAKARRRTLEEELMRRCLDAHEGQAAASQVLALHAITKGSQGTPQVMDTAGLSTTTSSLVSLFRDFHRGDGNMEAVLEVCLFVLEHLSDPPSKEIIDQYKKQLHARCKLRIPGAVSSIFNPISELKYKSTHHQVSDLIQELRQAGRYLKRCMRLGREDARKKQPQEETGGKRLILPPSAIRKRHSILEEVYHRPEALRASCAESFSNAPLVESRIGSGGLYPDTQACTGVQMEKHGHQYVQLMIRGAAFLQKAKEACVAWSTAKITMLNSQEPGWSNFHRWECQCLELI